MNAVKLSKRVLHELELNDNFYDGRFRERKINDKKREAERRACRKFRIKMKEGFNDKE